MNDIARKIRSLREAAGLSLSQLADKAGLSLAYISKLESGVYKTFSLLSSRSLADGLGISLKDFLEQMGFLDNNQERPSFELLTHALRRNGYTREQADKVVEYAEYIKSTPPSKAK